MSLAPRETILLVLLGGLCGSLAAEEQLKRDPIAPIFRSELGKTSRALPFRAGYRWSYTSDGRFSLFLETGRGPESEGLRLTALEAKRDTFFWTHRRLVLGFKDHALLDFGDGWRRSASQEPPQLLSFPLKAGLRWSFAEPPVTDCHSGFEAVVVGKENVTVPAGTFEAWRIEYVLYPRLGTEHDFRAWYVPGLGFARIEKWRESGPNGKTVLEKPIVHELALVEEIATAHRVDYPSAAEPLKSLPKHVQAAPGQVTLFADFGDIWDGQVVLYLVNRSQDPIRPPSPRWEVWPKLEARSDSGAWERAQPHYEPFCTTGDYRVALEPGRFTRLLGYLPRSGSPREVRFKLLGDVDAVSNAGPGLSDPQDIEDARYDDIGMPAADAALLMRFFFEAARKSERIRDRSYVAFARLRSLPSEDALPTVNDLLQSDEWMGIEHRQILQALDAHDHERFLTRVKEVLAGPPGKRRTWLFEDLCLLPCETDIAARLLEEARDPKSPWLRPIIEWFAFNGREELRPLLAEIEKDPRYGEGDRLFAGLKLSTLFGTFVVQMGVAASGEAAPGPGAQGTLDVSITHTTAITGPLQFSYSDPANVLKLYASVGEEILVPRPGVRWFTAPNPAAKQTKVSLGDGATHVFRINLEDYFDLPPVRSGEDMLVSVAVGFSIPGRHDIPQVAFGSILVPVKTR